LMQKINACNALDICQCKNKTHTSERKFFLAGVPTDFLTPEKTKEAKEKFKEKLMFKMMAKVCGEKLPSIFDATDSEGEGEQDVEMVGESKDEIKHSPDCRCSGCVSTRSRNCQGAFGESAFGGRQDREGCAGEG
jgi:hypothetical protein